MMDPVFLSVVCPRRPFPGGGDRLADDSSETSAVIERSLPVASPGDEEPVGVVFHADRATTTCPQSSTISAHYRLAPVVGRTGAPGEKARGNSCGPR